ncbi:hypothetical protein JL101_013290 [Skermanella rosea]|uniref:hypothetical protein n=1 Tax=Skermanella rosea TaxID=1817965 RepID=UPI001933B6EF|nr:hypothetical protein [Skermanella rosea]UEM06359.1 hypothetical protein JL101_013290 [Skermanella rosea]
MKWVKGVSGNPGGRPKLEVNIRNLAQQNSMEALETLVEVMRTGKPGERLIAANAILDRAYGRPTQSVEMSGSRETLVDLLVSLNTSSTANASPTASMITDTGRRDSTDAESFTAP